MKKIIASIVVFILLVNIPIVSSDSVNIYIIHNDADAETAKELAEFLELYVNVEEVSADKYLRVINKEGIKVIIGGPDAYDGIGKIVEEIIPASLSEKLRKEYYANICYKTDFYGQDVYIIAGYEREQTKEALKLNPDNDAFDSKGEILLNTDPNMYEIPSQYKGFILDLAQDNIAWAREVVQKHIGFEDNKLTSIEKNALKSPEDYKKNNDALVDHYLDELDKKYSDLVKEIKKIPEYKNSESIEDITYLFLNGNAEVKEAFDLMLKGGTPDPNDFDYPVPQYNTELQVLKWLAEQNEFRKENEIIEPITIDGYDNDWKNTAPLIVTDPEGDALSKNTDIKELRFVRDNSNLYISFEIATTPSTSENVDYYVKFDINGDGKRDYGIDAYHGKVYLDKYTGSNKFEQKVLSDAEVKIRNIVEIKLPLKYLENPTSIDVPLSGVWLLKERDASDVIEGIHIDLSSIYKASKSGTIVANDTLALAIAMVNGIYITIGDTQVKNAVKKDTNDSLEFFRETNKMQEERGFYPLEAYPLEAKVCLAWRGNETGGWAGPYALSQNKRIDIIGYKWNNVSLETLKAMRKYMEDKKWINKDTTKTISMLEEFFFFKNWEFQPSWEEMIEINGRSYKARNLNNANFEFEFFLKNGKGYGVCGDWAAFLDAWAKSWGIATTVQGWLFKGFNCGHGYVTFYDPSSKRWRAYEGQLNIIDENANMTLESEVGYQLFKPPVNQIGYLKLNRLNKNPGAISGSHYEKMWTINGIKQAFLQGVPTTTIKQWLLYS